MQIICNEGSCIYCDNGECTLSRAGSPGSFEKSKCAYYIESKR